MSQAGFTPIQLYFSTTAAATPSAGNLANGELAINITDGRLFYKDNGGVVKLLASNAGSAGDVVGPGSSTDNALVRFDSTTGKLVQNSVGILSDAGVLTGLTGLTSSGNVTLSSLTSGRVPYASTGGLLVDSANLLYSGTDLTVYGLTVGRGAGAVSTNTAVGASALAANTSGAQNTTVVNQAGATTNAAYLTAVGYQAARYNTGDGNTAIGTNALLVAGGVNGTGTNNTAIGKDALYTNTTASNNTAVGYQAAYSNTTGTPLTAIGTVALYSNTTGVDNVAVGANALYANTTGNYNTAIGRYALQTNATTTSNTAVGFESLNSNIANNNTAIGYQSGRSNTTGIQSTFLGRAAGVSSTTGSYITAVGDGALEANTTGNTNTGIGQYALRFNTTASNNTAVGYQAMYSNVTGTSNVAVGHTALYSNTASSNTAVGIEAMVDNTSGASNSAFGQVALGDNTTGSFNVAVGVQALRFNTTASNNTAVGYQAGYNTTAAGLQTVVGYQAGYSVTSLSYGTYIGAKAGLNTTGNSNTFVGAIGTATDQGSGQLVTTGSRNTILGAYNGNQGGLDIRTGNNYIVLSDGDGNPRIVVDGGGFGGIGVNPANQYAAGGGASWQIGRSTNIWNYSVSGNDQTRIYNNAYLDAGAVDRYLNTNAAGMLIMADAQLTVRAAPSGTAGAVITFTNLLDVALNRTLALQGTSPNSGTGITFPASQNASSDANTLDDYEEGTFTPVLNFAGSTAGITYDTQLGRYTKVGNVVNVQIGLVLTSKGSAAGALQIAGLPFASLNPGAYGDGSLAISFCSAATATTPMMAIVQRGNTQLALNFTTTSSSDSVENTDVTNSFAIILGGSYISA